MKTGTDSGRRFAGPLPLSDVRKEIPDRVLPAYTGGRRKKAGQDVHRMITGSRELSNTIQDLSGTAVPEPLIQRENTDNAKNLTTGSPE